MPKGIYKHPLHGEEQKRKIGETVSTLWKERRKGKTYEEIFGIEKARLMREKMSQAKLGRKMPWNSVPERKGELSPRWIKDRTKLVKENRRGDSAYREWRRLIYIRDNFKCKIANQDCNGRIEAHHILTWKNYPELRYTINNGITLCHAHHPRRRAEEKKLEPIFMALLNLQVD